MSLSGKTIVAASSAEEQDEAPPAKIAKRDEEPIRVRARDGEEVTIVAASSAEEQEGAPPAKKAKRDDEQIRVRARDGEEVTMSREVARLAGHLKDLMDDAPPEDGVYPVPAIAAWTLDLLGKLSAPDSTRPSVDECSMSQLMELVEGALFLDANRALEHIQRAIAQRLNGQRAHDLCVVLGAGSDFDGAEERAAALAEPAFLPEAFEAQQQPAATSTAPPALQQQPSFSGLPATEDAKEAALGLLDVVTLCELKGVNRSWRALSRRVLCSRLCRGRGQPPPTQLDEITDLDVELLIEAGRPGDAAVAGRMLPGLARLRGYGYVVDVAAVRAADLQCGMGDWRRPSLLHGAAKEALHSCISGEGEPPLRLTIAAVACAGSGGACGIPVQHMREGTVTELDLCNKGLHGPAVMLIAYLLPAMSALRRVDVRGNNLGIEGWSSIFSVLRDSPTSKISAWDLSGENLGPEIATPLAVYLSASTMISECNLRGNKLDSESAKVLAKIGVEKGIMLLGIKRDQKEADFANQGLGPSDAILIASDIATGALTNLNLSSNNLCSVTETGYIKASQVQGSSFNEGDIVVYQGKEMIVSKAKDRDGDIKMTHLPDMSGLNALADAFRVNGSLTSIDVRGNKITGDGAAQLSAAVLGNLKIEMFNGIPIKEMRANSITELDLKDKKIDNEGGMVVAALIPAMSVLARVNVRGNNLGVEGWTIIFTALRDSPTGTITAWDLSGENLGPGIATPLAEFLSASTMITECNLRGNKLDSESAKVLAKIGIEKGIMLFGIKRDQKEADFANQGLGPSDAILIASDIATGALTSLNLSSNNLCSVTETGYIKASQVQGSSFNEGDIVVYQGKEMIVSKAKDRDGDIKMTHLPDMSGLNALADAFRVNGSLTSIDVRGNNITGNSAAQLSAAVLGNLKIEMFNEIPIKEMRANSITELDLKDKKIDNEGGMVVAALIPAMSVLARVDVRGNNLGVEGWTIIFNALRESPTSTITAWDLSGENLGPGITTPLAEYLSASTMITECNLRGNKLDSESAKVLAKIGVEKGIMLFGIKRDQKEANFANQGLGPADIILIASDIATGSLTRVDVRGKNITGDGAAQLSDAVLGNLKIEMFNGIPIKEMRANSITELDLKDKEIGDEGGMVVAALIPVVSLAKLRLGGLRPGSDGSVFGPEVRADLVQSVLTLAAHLRHLDLGGLEVGADEAVALVSAGRALQTLRLGEWVMPVGELRSGELVSTGGLAVGEAEGAVVGALLKASTSLSTLDLSGSSCAAEAARLIGKGLRESAAPLAELRLANVLYTTDGRMPFEAVLERQAALMSGACRLSLREVDCSAQAIEATDTAVLQRLALLFAPELKVESATLGDDGRSVRLVKSDGRALLGAVSPMVELVVQQCTDPGGCCIGAALPGKGALSSYLGEEAGSWGYRADGVIKHEGSRVQDGLPTYKAGDRIRMTLAGGVLAWHINGQRAAE
ncbi:protein nlrc3-like protein, partial [Chrysochromulina tobinii]